MKKIQIQTKPKYTGTLIQFSSDLKSYITSDVNQLITNSNVASLLADSDNYEIDKVNDEINESTKPKIYKSGKFDGIQIMVDPYMSWDNNRIILKNNEIIIDEIKVIDEECLFI